MSCWTGVSIDDLFKPPARAQAKISPDGTHIAYLAPWRDRLNIWVQRVEDESVDARRVTADETRSILHYDWTDDSRWLLYLQDTGGDENSRSARHGFDPVSRRHVSV